MTRLLPLFVLGATALVAAAPGQSFRRNQQARVTVDARAAGPLVKTARAVDLTLTATPRPGIHVYAPGNPDYIAVTVTLMPVPGLSIGPPVFPAGEDYFFAPLKESVKVYSKPFVIRVPVTATTAFVKGRAKNAPPTVTMTGSVDYQACDDKVCFPPQSQPFSVEVPVALGRR